MKSLFECPPLYDIILGKCVVQLHNPAIALRHIKSKNNSTKYDFEIPTYSSIVSSIHLVNYYKQTNYMLSYMLSWNYNTNRNNM